MLQRAELYRRLDVARAALRPGALVSRGKYRIDAAIDDAAHTVSTGFRNNRLPIALAATAGLVWLFRDPIKDHAPRLVQKIQDMVADIADHFRGPEDRVDEDDSEELEEDDEAVR
ncbi:MAG: hypothetical protein KYX64_07570 [Sphingopyxis sp.]|nr:hypothetical protein [Sphingopyxis sp.]